MSSLTRRLQIRMLKRVGYVREKYRIDKGDDGQPKLVPVLRGGVISNPAGDSIGYRWPGQR